MKKNIFKKTMCFALASALSLSLLSANFSLNSYAKASTEELDTHSLVILSTNDCHCSIDSVPDEDPFKSIVGYAGLAGAYKYMQGQYANVALVDAGDHIQGAPIGLLTQGQSIIDIMNYVGFTASTLGNHEFDYGLSRLFELTHPDSTYEKKANYPYVSCNFMDLSTNQPVYNPYDLVEYQNGDDTVTVAYIGVTTPETITVTASDTFLDEDGNIAYGFCQDDTGEALYRQIQATIDDAKANGAEYVVILGHIGQDGRPDKWRSDTIVKNITGVDLFIDGHSHEKYVQTVSDKEGKDVIISQTGTNFYSFGLSTIDFENHTVTSNIIGDCDIIDSDTAEFISDINAEFDEILNEKVAETSVLLNVYKEDNYNWLVRESETNMGDLLTDAFRVELGTDISIIGGGSIRNKIEIGDITYRDALSVQPFGNDVAVIKATGQEILDALEMGAMKYPEASGAFMQVSGLTYEIANDIPSSVVTDTDGNFLKVDGTYRVRNVKVSGAPLDLAKEYTIGGIEYTLLKGGDGLHMFNEKKSLIASGTKDIEIFANYLKKLQVIGEEYGTITGQGRITFVSDASSNPEEPNTEPSTSDNNTTTASNTLPTTTPNNNTTSPSTSPNTSPTTGDNGFASLIVLVMLAGGIAVASKQARVKHNE